MAECGVIAETDRVLLRPWRVEEAGRFFDMHRRMEVARWIGGRPMTDRDEARPFIQRMLDRLNADPRFGTWAVVERATGVVAGSVLLKPLPDGAGEIEIGWHLHPDSWGRGLATEAARPLLARGFALGLAEIWAVTHPNNHRSVRVCEKLGMRLLGTTTRWYHEPSLMFWVGARADQQPTLGADQVYVAPPVAAVRALWDRSGLLSGRVIQEQLCRFAEALVDAHAAGERSAAVMIRNWSDSGDDDLRSAGTLSLRHARAIVARDHGFTAWSSVEGECDPTFELAVDAVVHGRIHELSALLANHPDLPVRRSAYGHRATLLHYVAANGVEIRRQVVPANAAEIVAALLDAGAERSATFHAYGAEVDVLAMLTTSAHPHDAGVAGDIERALAANLDDQPIP